MLSSDSIHRHEQQDSHNNRYRRFVSDAEEARNFERANIRPIPWLKIRLVSVINCCGIKQ